MLEETVSCRLDERGRVVKLTKVTEELDRRPVETVISIDPRAALQVCGTYSTRQ